MYPQSVVIQKRQMKRCIVDDRLPWLIPTQTNRSNDLQHTVYT